MVDERDWRRAYAAAIAQGRERVPPPTPEQLVAYAQRQLNEAEAERVRESLAYYPELAALLAEDDIETEVLSDAERIADWDRPEEKRSSARPFARSRSIRPWQWATAASWLLVLGVGAWAYHLRNESAQPRENVERVVLLEAETRGPGTMTPVTLQASTRYIMLVLTSAREVSGGRFRVEIRSLNATPPRLVWQSTILQSGDGAFLLEVPRSFLTTNTYDVRLYAEDDATPIARYRFWLTKSN